MQGLATSKKVTIRNSQGIATAGASWQKQPPLVRQVLRGLSLQPKLTIGAPNDACEREADRVADRVMGLSDTEVQASIAPTGVQRLCPECDEEVHAKPDGGGSNPAVPVSPAVRKVLRSPGTPLDADTRAFLEPGFGRDFSRTPVHRDRVAADEAKVPIRQDTEVGTLRRTPYSPYSPSEGRIIQGDEESVLTKADAGSAAAASPSASAKVEAVVRRPGAALPPGTRRFMESRLGYDLGGVRIHSDGAADEAAKSIDARAFTKGSTIVFANGQYSPDSQSGRWLLAHEITHVVQQQTVLPLAGDDPANRLSQRGFGIATRDRSSLLRRVSWGTVVFSANQVAHSGIVYSVSAPGAVVDDNASRLDSKWGQLALNRQSWAVNAAQYGLYETFSKAPLTGVCAGKGANER